jgi:hypothetical protein
MPLSILKWSYKSLTAVLGGATLFAAFSPAAHAATATSSVSAAPASETELNVNQNSFDLIHLDPGSSASIGFESFSYLHPPTQGVGSSYPAVTAQVQGTKTGDFFEITGRAEAMLLLQQGSPYGIEAPEVYFGTPKDEPVHLRIGRKLETWSRLDDLWQLGIVQPRYNWDQLHPESVALTGIFLDVDVKDFRWLGFWSPIYIPERGMPVNNIGGSIFTADPFGPNPSNSALISSTLTPVNYTLQIPSTSQIISQKSYGTMIQFGEKDGFFGSLAYAYKPINQLLFAYSGYLTASSSEAMVTLYPEVAYHHVTDADFGYQSKHFDAWVSLLDDNPDSIQTGNSTYTYQEVTRSDAEALAVAYKPDPSKAFLQPSTMLVSYLHQTGGNAPDQGPYATGTGSVFTYRYPYQSALMGELAGKIGTIDATSKLIYDVGHQGTIWSTDVTYHLKRSWIFRVGADVLSSSEDIAAQDFISRYRADDRLYTGVSYVF